MDFDPRGSSHDDKGKLALEPDKQIALYPINYDRFHRTEYRPDPLAPSLELSEADFERFRKFISEKIGLAYAQDQRRQLEFGLAAVMSARGCRTPDELFELLAASSNTSPIWDQVVSQLTIGETYFFRNSSHFDVLTHHILPEILAKRSAGERRIRIWSAGCASGEEPYSIAILLRELIPDPDNWKIFILGTDINRSALDKARAGVYAAWSFRGVEKRVQETYFRQVGEKQYALVDQIKRMVTFDQLNLVQDPYPSLATSTNAMDIIFCRNVTIYFDGDVTRRVVSRLRQCLSEGGWYIPGPSEPNMILYTEFEQRNFPGAVVYRKAPAPAPPIRLAARIAPVLAPPPAPIYSIAKKNAPSRIKRIASARCDPYQFALGLIEQDRCEEALVKLHEKIEQDANFVPALYMLGKIYANKGEVQQARHWCEQAIAHDALYPEPYYVLSLIYQGNGSVDRAVDALKKAIFLDREFVMAHYNLGQIYRRKGELELANKSLQNVVRLLEHRTQEEWVREGDGLKVGRLLEIVQSQLKEA